jgi:hypothetical protein
MTNRFELILTSGALYEKMEKSSDSHFEFMSQKTDC